MLRSGQIDFSNSKGWDENWSNGFRNKTSGTRTLQKGNYLEITSLFSRISTTGLRRLRWANGDFLAKL